MKMASNVQLEVWATYSMQRCLMWLLQDSLMQVVQSSCEVVAKSFYEKEEMLRQLPPALFTNVHHHRHITSLSLSLSLSLSVSVCLCLSLWCVFAAASDTVIIVFLFSDVCLQVVNSQQLMVKDEDQLFSSIMRYIEDHPDLNKCVISSSSSFCVTLPWPLQYVLCLSV